jgi:hypothetical protein
VGVEEVELDGDGRGIPIVGDLARDAAAIDRAGGLQGASRAASEPDRLDFFRRELAW